MQQIIKEIIGIKLRILILTTAFLFIAVGPAYSAEYQVKIENHRFIPNKIEMERGVRHRLIVLNTDATAEEFESYELNREKIISGKSKAVIFLPPLTPGSYPFFGEFHEDTAQGRIIVK